MTESSLGGVGEATLSGVLSVRQDKTLQFVRGQCSRSRGWPCSLICAQQTWFSVFRVPEVPGGHATRVQPALLGVEIG